MSECDNIDKYKINNIYNKTNNIPYYDGSFSIDVEEFFELYPNDHNLIPEVIRLCLNGMFDIYGDILPDYLLKIAPLYGNNLEESANLYFGYILVVCTSLDVIKYYLQNYEIIPDNTWFFCINIPEYEIVKYLLDYSAYLDDNKSEYKFKLNCKDSVSGNSELHDILQFPKKYDTTLEFVKLLVDHNANLECTNNADQTPYELLLAKKDLYFSDNFLEIKNYLENIISE